MSKDPNHTCKVCGNSYYACDSCADVKDFAPWRTICDTEKHYRIFNIIMMVKNEILSECEAKEQLIEMGITNEEILTFTSGVKNAMQSILSSKYQHDEIKTKKTKKKLPREILNNFLCI
ncbi:MAG: hypothetical protein RR370_01855 [Synergistaceae bacterium]